MRSKNKGVISLSVLIGAFVVLLGVSVYWYVKSNEKLEITNYELSDTSDWKTYRNEEYGFEFSYPEVLSVEPIKSFGDAKLSLKVSFVNGLGDPIYISIYQNKDFGSVVKMFEYDYEPERDRTVEEINLSSGHKATKISYPTGYGGIQDHYIYQNGNTIVVIGGYMYRKLDIVNTFKFTK